MGKQFCLSPSYMVTNFLQTVKLSIITMTSLSNTRNQPLIPSHGTIGWGGNHSRKQRQTPLLQLQKCRNPALSKSTEQVRENLTGNILPESYTLKMEQVQEEVSQSFLTLLCLLCTTCLMLGSALLFWTS